MNSVAQSCKKVQYIRPTTYKNLFVIPYIRGRLVFAEMAARAITEENFDLVLVDLPYFLNNAHSVLPTGLFPGLSSLVIRTANSTFFDISFTPNDAACIAIATTQMLKDDGITRELKFIDDSNVLYYHEYLDCPDPRLQDDYFVFVKGLEEYFAKPNQELKAVWDDLPATSRLFQSYRADQVAERLRHFVKNGKKTLFVCEYKLWRLVSGILQSGYTGAKEQLFIPWRNVSAALVIEDPFDFWIVGLLDDFPVVAKSFYGNLELWNLPAFDKLKEINHLIHEALSIKKGRPSFRKMFAFRHYLRNRLTADFRFVPLPVSHLYDTAEACFARGFANELAKRFLHYPMVNKKDVARYLTVHQDAVISGGDIFEFPDLLERLSGSKTHMNLSVGDRIDERIKIVNRIHPRITQSEKKDFGGGYGIVRWETATDYALHQITSKRARDIAERSTRADAYRARRSWGSMGEGIHMKATIASKARFEDVLYIKQKKSFREKKSRLNEATPTVFLFVDNISNDPHKMVYDGNSTQRKIDLQNSDQVCDSDPQPDRVFSVFMTYRKELRTCDGHIDRQELTSLVFLYNRHMGVERYNNITRRAKRFQCRLDPTGDKELYGFTMSELGTAWGIKYAEGAIIVVASDRWKPSHKLAEFAKGREVEILHISLSRFSPATVERMRILHTISTALKKHPRRDNILDRFIQ